MAKPTGGISRLNLNLPFRYDPKTQRMWIDARQLATVLERVSTSISGVAGTPAAKSKPAGKAKSKAAGGTAT